MSYLQMALEAKREGLTQLLTQLVDEQQARELELMKRLVGFSFTFCRNEHCFIALYLGRIRMFNAQISLNTFLTFSNIKAY